MKLTGVKRFTCPDCDVGVDVHGVGADEHLNLYLVGTCPTCKDNVAIDLMKVFDLFGGNHAKGN